MAIVELQISSQPLLALVQSRFTQGDRGVGTALNVAGHTYMISKVDVQPDTALHADQPDTSSIRYLQKDWVSDTVTTKKVQVTQSVAVSVQDVVPAPDGTPQVQDVGTYTVHARIRMNAWIDGSATPETPRLFMSLETVDTDVPDPQLKPALTAFAQGLFMSTSSPIALYGDVTYANAGVMASADLSRVAVRIEVGEGNAYSYLHWQNFYNGNVADRLNIGGPLPWSVFVEARLVELQVQTAMWEGMNAHPDKLRFNWWHHVSWAPNNLSPELNASFNADAIDACHGPGGVPTLGDVNLDITSHLVLGMATDAAGNLLPNQFMSRTHVDWDANDLDVVECAVLFGSAGHVTGAVVGALFGPSGIAIGAIVGFVGGFVTVIIVASVYVPAIKQPKCNQVSDHDLVCQQRIPVALPQGGVLPPLQVTQVLGIAEGMVLSGSINSATLTTAAVPQLSLEAQNFRWEPPVVSCGSAGPSMAAFLVEHLDMLATASATISLTNAGSGNLVLRGFQVLSPDPDGIFTGHIQTYQYVNSAAIEVRCPLNATYATHPYLLRLLIRTNGGNAIVTLGPIPALDENMRQRLEAVVLTRIGDCYTPIDDWWRHFHSFNPHWLIDPPPGDAHVYRWEIVEVQGIPEGAGVRLEDGQGAVLGVARADAAGVAHLGLVMSDQDADPVLTRLQEDREEQPQETHDVTVSGVRIVARQVELAEQTRLELGDEVRGIATSMLDGAAHVFALVGPNLHVYRLANPQRPLLVRLFPAAGARRFVTAGRHVALAGESGVAVYTSEGRELVRVAGSFTDLAVFGDALVAVAEGRMILLSLHDLALHDLEPLEGATTLTATSRHLVVGTRAALQVYEPEGRLLRHVQAAEIEGIETLSALPGLHPRTGVLGVRRDGSAVVVDFVDPRRPRVLADYHSVPRFMAMSRVGNLIVEAGNAGSLNVTTIGRNLRV